MISFLAITVLGLAVLVTSEVLGRYLTVLREVRAVALIVVGVAVAWIGHIDVFSMLNIGVRNSELGVTLTGFILGGSAYFWHDVLGLFDGLGRKYLDQAHSIEKSEGLRRVA